MERNWSGNVEYSARHIERPTTLDELRSVVRNSARVRVLGTRHSFNRIADAEVLVSLESLAGGVEIDSARRTVELNPAITYGRLAGALQRHGLALHNLASLPHISVGGAIATSTHGSGDVLGSLATAVRGIDILRSDGEVVPLERGHPDFDGAVVGLGALGAVVRVRLDLEPDYEIAQHVFEGVSWERLMADFDAITGAGYSVSLFTRWRHDVEQMWVKQRVPATSPSPTAFGASAAQVDVHPIQGVSAENCTTQCGVPGPWCDRLPHFKMGYTPSRGDELQSEVLLPRAAALSAFGVLRELADDLAPHLFVSEIRTVAADALWMSPQYERDTVAIHFTWRPNPEVVALVARIEAALAEFEPRPHWGKVFTIGGTALRDRYPRATDFVELVRRYDPRRAFANQWLDDHVLA